MPQLPPGVNIGDGVGALVVRAPSDMAGREIEICPAGVSRKAEYRQHVAVLARAAGALDVHTAVFPSLSEGRYELWAKPDGPTRLIATVMGGRITDLSWPDG
jgi:hypothetical protein